jgi:hypothetical protein
MEIQIVLIWDWIISELCIKKHQQSVDAFLLIDKI